MRIFKTRLFAKWARKERLSDQLLYQVIQELKAGLVDADLGGHVYKKRIAIRGHGKRGGARSIIAYNFAERAFFIFGYAKNRKGNIDAEDLAIAKEFASEILSYSIEELNILVKEGELIEVKYDG